jgi:hypothetical protein
MSGPNSDRPGGQKRKEQEVIVDDPPPPTLLKKRATLSNHEQAILEAQKTGEIQFVPADTTPKNRSIITAIKCVACDKEISMKRGLCHDGYRWTDTLHQMLTRYILHRKQTGKYFYTLFLC